MRLSDAKDAHERIGRLLADPAPKEPQWGQYLAVAFTDLERSLCTPNMTPCEVLLYIESNGLSVEPPEETGEDWRVTYESENGHRLIASDCSLAKAVAKLRSFEQFAKLRLAE